MNRRSGLRLEFDWQDPGGARGEELRATWASLAIYIDCQPVTEVLDERTRSVRNRIYLPLFPLAEWIADNWWFLQAETEIAGSVFDFGFERRHSFQWARDGFVLPSLRLVTLGRRVDARWQPLAMESAGIRFLSSGNAVLDSDELYAQLREFVNAVIARLDESGVTGTALHEQWSAIENVDREELDFCLASARLGVDAYDLPEGFEANLLNVARTVRKDLLNDFLSLTNKRDLWKQAQDLRAVSAAIAGDQDSVDALAQIRSRKPDLKADLKPWRFGYRFAAELRRTLNGSDWKSPNLESLAGILGIDKLDKCLLEGDRDCQFFDALAGTNHYNAPKFVIEKKRPDSRQFAFCRAMFEHLTLPPGRFALVSRMRTDRQRMSRAFAAEFLVPQPMLKKDLSSAVVGEDEIEDLASAYGVSPFVIRHQIKNHRLAGCSM